MNNLNSVLVEGNLVRDPSFNRSKRGDPVANFTIASHRYYNSSGVMEKEVSFFDVVAWGARAEAVKLKGVKGRGVRVVGRLKQDRWTEEDGTKRSKIEIYAEHVEFRPDFRKETPVDEEEFVDTQPIEDTPFDNILF